VGQGLVEQQHRGPGREGRAHHAALPLAGGGAAGVGVERDPQADARGGGGGVGGAARAPRPERQLVADGAGHQGVVGGLGHGGEPAGALRGRQRRRVHPVELDQAGDPRAAPRQRAGQEPQQRGLAAAGGPRHQHPLAGLHRERQRPGAQRAAELGSGALDADHGHPASGPALTPAG
jgi:hypothetical protein